MRSIAVASFGLVSSLLIACGGDTPTATNPTPTTSGSAASSATPTGSGASTNAPAPGDQAYTLLMEGVSCWLGGMWGDAEGEKGFTERHAGNERRCMKVVKDTFGKEDQGAYEALRNLDPSSTEPVLTKVAALAKSDGLDAAHADALRQLGAAVATAARESLAAHHAVRKIKMDIDKLKTDKDKQAARDKDADKLTADEAAAVMALKAGSALTTLISLNAGDYTKDAHAIAVLIALGRVRISYNLPRHMKIYTVAPAYSALFGVTAPAVPEKANAPLKPGTWLSFEIDVAKAAGHAVPDSAKTAKERAALAWSGILAGFEEKLQADQGLIKSPALGEVVNHAIGMLANRSEKAAENAIKEEKKDEKKDAPKK